MTLVPLTGALALAGQRDGDRALQAGRLEEALRHFEGAARAGQAEGHAGIGRVRLAQRRFGEALQAFRRAREIDPALAVAWYGEGAVLKSQAKCPEAVPLFEKATALDRRFPGAQLALGECLGAIGQHERSIVELERGLKWGKAWTPRFLAARGAVWMARDSLRRAAADFTRARELAPRDASIRRAIGSFYAGRGTWALAIPELQAAVALDSTDTETMFELARALFYEQRYDESFAVYQRLVARDPDHAPARLGLGDLLFRASTADPRRLPEARAHLAQYVRLAPEDPTGWSLLGRASYRMGMADSAFTELREAERLGDRSKDLYTTLGTIHADRKEWEQAGAAFEQGEVGPKERTLLAQIYEITGRPERADSIYTSILARDSTSGEAAFAFRQKAKLAYRAEQFAPADSLFARSLAADSTSGEAWFYRGLSLRQLGRHAEALASLQKAAAIDSTRADRYFWLGVLEDGQKRLDDAEKAFMRAAEIDSTGELAPRAFRQLGYYSLLDKRWGDAIRWLDRAVGLDPKDPMAWLWLAQGHQNAGHRQRAVDCYRRVLALDPKSAGARKGLEVLGSQGGADAREAVAKDGP